MSTTLKRSAGKAHALMKAWDCEGCEAVTGGRLGDLGPEAAWQPLIPLGTQAQGPAL